MRLPLPLAGEGWGEGMSMTRGMASGQPLTLPPLRGGPLPLPLAGEGI